jgi:transcription initiation factor TFIID TATA-box-binding protein
MYELAPRIVNVVSTAELCSNVQRPINLRLLINTSDDLIIKYQPERFIAAILKQKDDSSSTCLLFDSGKIVCVGSSSIEKSREAATFFIRKIYLMLLMESLVSTRSISLSLESRISLPLEEQKPSMENFQVRNIVVAASLGQKINLIEFEKSTTSPKEVMFVPELFPGLKWRPYSSKKITIILFESGKMNITGIRSIDQIESTYEFARRRLLKFKK